PTVHLLKVELFI
ncbi:putative outer membrane protein pmp6, partial [Chlamydia psittaci C6/98]